MQFEYVYSSSNQMELIIHISWFSHVTRRIADLCLNCNDIIKDCCYKIDGSRNKARCIVQMFYSNTLPIITDCEAINLVKISIICHPKSQANPDARPKILHTSFNDRLTESGKQIIQRIWAFLDLW